MEECLPKMLLTWSSTLELKLLMFSGETPLEIIIIHLIGMVNSVTFLIFWDFAHAWLLCSLDAIKLRSGSITGSKNPYSGNRAYWQAGGILLFLFDILPGVFQGCPLSGTLFVVVIDSLLWAFQATEKEIRIGQIPSDSLNVSLERPLNPRHFPNTKTIKISAIDKRRFNTPRVPDPHTQTPAKHISLH